MKNICIICLTILFTLNAHSIPLGTAFTYQGELIVSDIPAHGLYDFNVEIYSDPINGVLLDSEIYNSVIVENGLFSIDVDVGGVVFAGDSRWLSLGVRMPLDNNFTTLSPRQLITNAPFAIQSQFVGANGVDFLAIQDNAVTTPKIENNAITEEKIAINAIGTLNIINESISGVDIADDTITNTQIAVDTITHTEIATSAIRSDEILNGTIVAADINNNSVQQRITGSCASGSSIASILANGTVTCEIDDTGTSGWGLTGNAGTTPGTNFIGTTDNQPLIIKANNKQALIVENAPNQFGELNIINAVLGSSTNSFDKFTNSRIEDSIILGGNTNEIKTTSSSDLLLRSSIIGGSSNIITNASEAGIIGGYQNRIFTLGERGFIGGGQNNEINGYLGFAAGFGSKVNHDGSWVWNDWSDTNIANSFATTANNQFLIRAEGGFGIGTNAPVAPLHIKGEGKTFGVLADEVVLTVDPKETTDDVSIAINRLDSTRESALAFTTNQSPDFDIRIGNGSALDFNSYSSGSASFMMRINSAATNRIDFNTNLEPQSHNVFNFGSASFRWKTLYSTDIDSTNAVNVTSDKRLKDNIKSLDYGLSEVLAMRPVSYSMKNSEEKNMHLGLIAQEVEQILPEIVSQKDDEARTRSMRYGELIPVLIKATQEQQVLIDSQNQQIKKLQTMVNSLINNHNK